MPLSHSAVRVLGALLEKARTTPDAYPLTMQALVAACNQRTAREPITGLSQREVEEAMQQLRDRGLAATVRRAGDRVPKHLHRMHDAVGLRPVEEAIVSVLMLRGPQTVGELRTRTERYGGMLSPATIEATLADLSERKPPMVENRGRGPGQSQDRWEHTLGSREEERRPRAREASASQEAENVRDARTEEVDASELLRRIRELEARVARLEAKEG